jgi:hypothetical protein
MHSKGDGVNNPAALLAPYEFNQATTSSDSDS